MLVTVDRYRAITGDVGTAPVEVSARVEEAQDELAEVLQRPLELDEHTELLIPTSDGRLWPRATPIVSATGYTIDGYALRSSWIGNLSTLPFGTQPAGVEVTYTGGWTHETVPRCIERDLANAAYLLGHRPTADAIGIDTTGASSIKVGDVAVAWSGGRGAPGTSLADRLRACWSRRTLSYRYRLPRAIGMC